MNKRIRQQMRAREKLQTVSTIMAILEDEQRSIWRQIVFIHPDDWEDAKRMYGDSLKAFFDKSDPKEESHDTDGH